MLKLQRAMQLQANRIGRIILLAVAIIAAGLAAILNFQDHTGNEAVTAAKKAIEQAETENKPVFQPTPEEKTLMARAVYSEARSEPFEGKVAIAAVIINRLHDPKFPDDVAGVIFQPDAFTSVYDGQFWLEPDQEAYQAVEEALDGEDPSKGALYYYNPQKSSSAWIFSRPTVIQIGRHVFAG